MEIKRITLDTLYGFGIYMTEPGLKANPHIRNRGRIVTDLNNNPLMFTNVDIAILNAEIKLGLYKTDYKLKVIKFNNRKDQIIDICNFESMQKINDNTYQVFKNDTLYVVRDQHIDKVQSIRYFIFENGDTNRTERKYGHQRNKYYINLIAKAATEYLYETGILAGVRKTKDEIEISFKNSTAKIHVLTNGLISNINKSRKELGDTPQCQRCIPFDNTLDKFTTLYSFVTKSIMEPAGFGYEGEIDKDIERVYLFIRQYIKYMVPEDEKLDGFKYKHIEFKGTIIVKN